MLTKESHLSRRVHDIMTACIKELEADDDEDAFCNAVVCGMTTTESLGSSSYATAMKTPQAEQWKTTIESELKSLGGNRTWIVVDKPPYVKPLAGKGKCYNEVYFTISMLDNIV
jgi:hypothetical protein